MFDLRAQDGPRRLTLRSDAHISIISDDSQSPEGEAGLFCILKYRRETHHTEGKDGGFMQEEHKANQVMPGV